MFLRPCLMPLWSPGSKTFTSLLSVLEVSAIQCGSVVSTLYPKQRGRGIATNNCANGGNGRRETDVFSSQEGWWHELAEQALPERLSRLLAPTRKMLWTRLPVVGISGKTPTVLGSGEDVERTVYPFFCLQKVCPSFPFQSPFQEGANSIVCQWPSACDPGSAVPGSSGKLLEQQIPRLHPTPAKH